MSALIAGEFCDNNKLTGLIELANYGLGSCYPSLWIVFGNGCHGKLALFYLGVRHLVLHVLLQGQRVDHLFRPLR